MTVRHPDTSATTVPVRARGYALAIVLLVAVLLSAALTSMFFALTSATKLTAKNLQVRKSQYACDGVANLAVGQIRNATALSTNLGALNGVLGSLRAAVEADGVFVDELSAEPSSDPRRTVVPSGGLAGLEVSVVDIDLRISLRQNEAPPCRARRVQPLASLSLFEFAAFSTGTIAVTPGSGRTYNVPRRTTYAYGITGASVAGSLNDMKARDATQAALQVPAAPEGWRSPLAAATPGSFFPGVPAAAGADLRFWLQPPNTGLPTSAPAELPGNRAAFDADLRIIDGEWFLRDLARLDAWPGIKIWSDHPCTDERDAVRCSNVVGGRHPAWLDDSLAVRRLYSHYERNGHGLLDGTGGAGVVSYGSVVGGGGFGAQEPASFLPASLCQEEVGELRRPSSCVTAEAGKDGPRAALLDAARAGFGDPELGARLPINIDVGLLGAALNTRRNGELGEMLCLPRGPDDPGGCTRVFNGIVYVSATRGTAAAAGAAGANPAADARVANRLPWALCGALSSSQASLDGGERPGYFGPATSTGCVDADYAKIDAVRLLRADDLTFFQHTGLTVITDLPVYVQGDWNRSGSAGTRTAIAAERVTVLSSRFHDGMLPPLAAAALPAPVAADPTSHVRVRASIFAGNPGAEATGVVRVLENKVDLELSGALATGFTAVLSPARPPEKLTWTFPSELFDAQPPGAPRATFVMPGARR